MALGAENVEGWGIGVAADGVGQLAEAVGERPEGVGDGGLRSSMGFWLAGVCGSRTHPGLGS
ncbi:MAG: hypothetical protein O2884_12890 [Chloroflexi bacterium]|nr:hypothetical protein [Chloroflexota bacterium]